MCVSFVLLKILIVDRGVSSDVIETVVLSVVVESVVHKGVRSEIHVFAKLNFTEHRQPHFLL